MKARVLVTLKRSVLDPQGQAVGRALASLGFSEVQGVRLGKVIELELPDEARDKSEERVRAMCEKLLANTVIEEYRIEWPVPADHASAFGSRPSPAKPTPPGA
jgi:phosphoribosylformylglycinamidine synthase